MSNKTRKRLWPASLVMAVAIVGVLAAFLALGTTPANTEAHDGASGPSHCAAIPADLQPLHDALAADHDCATGLSNTAPMAGDAIAAQTVAVGAMVTVQSTITDADADDTLAWTAMSSAATIATATVDNMGMVTVTGVGGGMATITVTADDGNGGTAMQTFTVRVTTIDAPTGVSAAHSGEAGQVVVKWTMSDDVDSYEVTYRVPGGAITRDSQDATSPHTITGLMAQTEYEVCVIAVVGSERSAPACDTATTSRYLLTFDQYIADPDRTDKGDITIPEDGSMAAPGAKVTLRATVWVPDPIASGDDTDTVAVRFMSVPEDLLVETANLLAVSDNSLDEGELTIRPRDGDKRSFEIRFECVVHPTILTVSIYDDNVDPVERGTITVNCGDPEPTPGPDRTDASDPFTVTSYGDWDFDEFTDGIVDEDDPAGVEHIVNDHHRATGMLHRDDPVVTGYQLGISAREDLESLPDGSPRRAKTDADLTREQKNADVEEGQRTVEVLVGAPNVQLTVTSLQAGPAYIRFLDKDMQPFGTDVDEAAMWRGADVVGLDSQGHLELNNVGVELSAAQALAYDQYTIVTPGIIPGVRPANSYLVGAAGAYNQGSFRIYKPCPTDDHYFYVQVHEAGGKYLRTTEKIDCIPPLRPGPTGLAFEIDSDKAGEGVLTFERGRAASSHTALLIDARNRNIVSEVTRSVGSERVQRIMFDNLNNGWTYHIVVIAHGANGQHTADALKDFQVRWLGRPDVPLSTTPSRTATRSHDLCNIEQDNKAAIAALLSDCDAAPADLTAPTGVMATANSGDVTVTWTDGANADGHEVGLVDLSDYRVAHEQSAPTGMSHTFTNVASGRYMAIVVSTMGTDYLYGVHIVTVP